MGKKTVQIQTINDLLVSIQDGEGNYALNPPLVTSTYDAASNSITIESAIYNISLNYPNSEYIFQINDLNYDDDFESISALLNAAIFVSITQDVTDAVINNGTKIDDTNSELADVKTGIDTVNTSLGTVNTSIDTTNTKLGSINTNIDSTNTKLDTVNTSIGTTNTSLGTVNTSIGTTNTKLDTVNTNLGTVNTSIGTTNTTLTAGTAKTQVVPTVTPTRLTVTSSAVATNGTVTAGALFIEFITSSDFTGTINGVTIPNLAISTYPYMPGYDYPAVAYTVTAGTLYIRKLTT